jgi:hypothetical protein
VVGFAILVTLAGSLFPRYLAVFCKPGDVVSYLAPVFRDVRVDISVRIWLWWFVNLSVSALGAEALLYAASLALRHGISRAHHA